MGMPEFFEHHDVAPQRAAVHFELARQLGAAGHFPRLQHLEQCQHAGGRLGHGQSRAELGRVLS